MGMKWWPTGANFIKTNYKNNNFKIIIFKFLSILNFQIPFNSQQLPSSSISTESSMSSRQSAADKSTSWPAAPANTESAGELTKSKIVAKS
jgi:hypothetical protein